MIIKFIDRASDVADDCSEHKTSLSRFCLYYLNPLDLERCFIGINFFIKFARSEMPTEYGLRDDVGRFGITDQAQGFECAIGKRGLEFVIQRIVGDSIC